MTRQTVDLVDGDGVITIISEELPPKYLSGLQDAANAFSSYASIRRSLIRQSKSPSAIEEAIKQFEVQAAELDEDGNPKGDPVKTREFWTGAYRSLIDGSATPDEVMQTIGLRETPVMRFLFAAKVVQQVSLLPCNKDLTEAQRARLAEEPKLEEGFWSDQLPSVLEDAAGRFCDVHRIRCERP